MPSVFNISSDLPFLEELAKGILARFRGKLDEAIVYLPTQRAVRPLSEALLKYSGSGALLLPKIQVLGDVDEEELEIRYFPGYEKIPQAISQTARLYELARLIHARGEMGKARPNFAQSVALAKSLTRLIDELQGKDLGIEALSNVVPEEFAEHWQITLDFLHGIAGDWKRYLEENNLVEPIVRRNKLLDNLMEYYITARPNQPVIIAGTTGTVPATVRLINSVLGLENGCLVLDGLDGFLRAEDFREIEETHPQYNLARLLRNVKEEPLDVAPWTVATEMTKRQKMISTALLPATRAGEWKDAECDGSGIAKIEAANLEEEAMAIAFVLRETLETAGRTAMVVTDNRALARRIVAKMKIWDVEVNDSAGQNLAGLPAATFLLDLIEMVRARQAPVQLLGFFKHPFVPAAVKAKVREIERQHLRGPRIEGFDIADHGVVISGLDDLSGLFYEEQVGLLQLIDLHLAVAEAVAPESELWGREGIEVYEFIMGLREGVDLAHRVDPELYPEILAQFLSTGTHRPKFGQHPRVNILSPAEARMQYADVVILGGMNEGGMPSLPEQDSFMNQQIRKKAGLDQLSRRIGMAAHDFELLSQANNVIYTRSLKEGGSPTIKSRFLQRLGAVCEVESADKYLHWARQFYQPAAVKPIARPEPRPPVEVRPKELSATRVGKLMRDPYVVYAEKILRLKKLPPVDEEVTGDKFGQFIHKSLELFSKNYDGKLETLMEIGRAQFAEFENKVGAKTFWWPKFLNIAEWFIANEAGIRRSELEQLFEVKGEYKAGGIKFTAEADRVEIDGVIKIIDYKTGSPPGFDYVEAGLDPQLAIEGIIFSAIYGKPVAALEYWYLKGRDDVVEIKPYKKDIAELLDVTRKGLAELAAHFARADTPYAARPWSRYALKYNDYEHLERIKEWSDE